MSSRLFVVPDIHGRDFWKKILPTFSDLDQVVFLGDYLDPYFYEGIDFPKALENFKRIIEFKKSKPEHVHLLVGNHDIHYIESDYGCSRYNATYSQEAEKLFRENKDLFDLYLRYLDTEKDKTLLFTHAGIADSWLESYSEMFKVGEVRSLDAVCTYLESMKDPSMYVESRLNDIGRMRGNYYTSGAGGPFWCDIRELMMSLPEWDQRVTQIVGHTQMEKTGYTLPLRNKDGSVAAIGCDSRAVFEWKDDHLVEYVV